MVQVAERVTTIIRTAHASSMRVKIKSNTIKRIKQDKYYFLLLILPIIYFIIFKYLPIIGNIIAFRKFSPGLSALGTKWVGLQYFRIFLVDPIFWNAFKNTLVLSLLGLTINFPIPIIFALLLNELGNAKFKKIVQTISYLPRFISVVVVVGMLKEVLSPSTGIVNILLQRFGIQAVFFINEPAWYRFIYISSDTWQFTGWYAIIYLAALANVDVQLYEAAIVDGAGKFRQMIHVTLPGIMPTIIITFVLNIGYLFSLGIEKVVLLYTPNNSIVSDTIDYYVYRIGLTQFNYSYATAVGLFSGVLALVLISSANYLSRRFSETSLY